MPEKIQRGGSGRGVGWVGVSMVGMLVKVQVICMSRPTRLLVLVIGRLLRAVLVVVPPCVTRCHKHVDL